VDSQWLTDYFDTLQVAGAKWDAHPQHGLNIVKQHSGREVRTYKVWVK